MNRENIRNKKIWHNNKGINIPITLKVYALKFKIDEAKNKKQNKTEIQEKLGNPLLRLRLQNPYFNNLQNIQFDNGGT